MELGAMIANEHKSWQSNGGRIRRSRESVKKSGKRCSVFTTMIGARSRFPEPWNYEVFTSVTKRFIAGFMRKFEYRVGKLLRELFKKISLKPSKTFTHFATLLQKWEKFWESLRDLFQKIFQIENRPDLSSRAEFCHWERRYRWACSWPKLFRDNGRTKHAIFAGGRGPKQKSRNRPKYYFIDISILSSDCEILRELFEKSFP